MKSTANNYAYELLIGQVCMSCFVIRHKNNLKFTVVKENELPENRHHHILKDEIIELTAKSKEKYPKRLRRVAIWDEKTSK